MSETQRCSQRIFSTRRNDMCGHLCQIKATVQHEGKWYCKLHHPDAVKSRVAAQDAKWKAEWKARREVAERRAAIEAAKAAVMQAARGWARHGTTGAFGDTWPVENTALLVAIDELERLEAVPAAPK